MRPIGDNFPAEDDQRLDRLVDGELSEAERCELLGGLDNEPGGWRRCALAFLEAQSWKEGLGVLVAGRQSGRAAAQAAARPAEPSWLSSRHGTWLAMAACFLIALFLISYAQHAWHRSGSSGGLPIEALVSSRPDRVSDPVSESGPTDSPGLALAAAAQPSAQPSAQAGTQPGPWETVTLSMPGGPQGGGQSIQLPVVNRDSIDDAWLRSLPAVMPADVLEALTRTGHQVRQYRELVPLEMNDGRRLVVPVDQVELHYIGNPTY